MKKILALTLAAVMAAGMTTVAFANVNQAKPDKNPEGAVSSEQGTSFFKGNDAYDQVIVPAIGKTYYVINEDGEVDTDDKIDLPLEEGDEIAIPVFIKEFWESEDTNGDDKLEWADGAGDSSKYILYTMDNDLNYDEDLEVWTDWDVNSAEVSTRFVKVDNNGRTMCVIVTVPDNNTDKIEDLVGTLKVGTTRTKAKSSNNSIELDISYAPDGTDKYYTDDFDGDDVLEAGKTGIVDFDTEAGEIEIEFGDKALFAVDVTGQSKLNLAWTTKFNSEIAALDESVNMDFITFTGEPSFNRTGTMYIYASDDTFLYKVVDGKLEKVDAKYNEDYEAWEFRTRTLDTYVIADGEIDLEAITDNTDDNSSTTDGGKVNPDTGR